MATALRNRPEGTEILIVAEALTEDSVPRVQIPSLVDAVQQYFRDPSDASRSRLDATVSELRAARRASALARWRGCKD